jgi:hypothetical protein
MKNCYGNLHATDFGRVIPRMFGAGLKKCLKAEATKDLGIHLWHTSAVFPTGSGKRSLARSLLYPPPPFSRDRKVVMSETISNQDRFLEATETGLMNLKEPVLETSGRATWLDAVTGDTARGHVLCFAIAAGLGFLLGKGALAIRRSQNDLTGALR